MKGAERPYPGTRIHSGFSIAFFLAVLVMLLVARGEPASEPDDNARISQAGSGKTIRVNVEEVRIDAVELGGNRRQITDLTADDFEIYQDGVLQEINACT